MQILDLPLDSIIAAVWNPNEMDDAMRARLRRSIQRFGFQVPVLVRRISSESYETIGGAHRLAVLKGMGAATLPCIVVEADDAEARLLSQALNHVAGSDNLGARAEVLRHILDALAPEDVLALLPETASSLQALTSIGQESISQALAKWQQAQQARLRHLAFQLTDAQLEVVEQVLKRLAPLAAREQGNPNKRGVALYLLCLGFLERAPEGEEYASQEERHE